MPFWLQQQLDLGNVPCIASFSLSLHWIQRTQRYVRVGAPWPKEEEMNVATTEFSRAHSVIVAHGMREGIYGRRLYIYGCRTACRYGGKNIAFHVNEGSTSFWLSLLVEFEDGDGDIGSMQLKQVTTTTTRRCKALLALFFSFTVHMHHSTTTPHNTPRHGCVRESFIIAAQCKGLFPSARALGR